MGSCTGGPLLPGLLLPWAARIGGGQMRRLLPQLLLWRQLLAILLLTIEGALHALLRRRQSRRLRQRLRLPCLLWLLHGWQPRQLLRLPLLLLLHGHGALLCPMLQRWLVRLLLWALCS